MVLIAFIFSAAFSLPGDSSKINYAPDDPRNPDCKCHQYQKVADKEYKRTLQREGKAIVAAKAMALQKDNGYSSRSIKPEQQALLTERKKHDAKQVKLRKSKVHKKRKKAKTGRSDACYKL